MLSSKILQPVLTLLVAVFPALAEPVVSGHHDKFRADLIHIRFPLHIYTYGLLDDHPDGSLLPMKVKVAPRVKCPSDILKEPTYDVSERMRTCRLAMPVGSRAIYSPGAELLFLETTESDHKRLEEVWQEFWFPPAANWHAVYSLDVRVFSKRGHKTTLLLDIKGATILSGWRAEPTRLELAASGEGSVRLRMEPVIGPDGQTCQIELEAVIKARDQSSIEKIVKMEVRPPTETEEMEMARFGESIVTLRIQVHRQLEYVGPPALARPAAKVAAIKEIRSALPGVVAGTPAAIEADLLRVEIPHEAKPDEFLIKRKTEGGQVTVAPQVPCESTCLKAPSTTWPRPCG